MIDVPLIVDSIPKMLMGIGLTIALAVVEKKALFWHESSNVM